MKFYELGNKHNPVILLLPGTCCHWRANFETVIPLLEKEFYVVCAFYVGKIYAAYGCSLGGSFAGLLVQRKKIHISHAILGSSDLDQEPVLFGFGHAG